MVKLHCDRCGEQIKDKYYTINIYSYDVDPKYDCSTIADCAYAYSNSRDGMLRMLNSQKMYCKDCVNKIEKFIGSNQ